MNVKFRYCRSVFRLRIVVTKRIVGNNRQETSNCLKKRFFIRIEIFLGADTYMLLCLMRFCHLNSECINFMFHVEKRGRIMVGAFDGVTSLVLILLK